MLELLTLALFQFATLTSSPTTVKGGSSGWSDGNATAVKGGSSGWSDGNVR